VQTTNPPVLCKDCKHYTVYSASRYLCEAPILGIDPVHGEPNAQACASMRQDPRYSREAAHNICGPDGRFFEQNESVPDFVPSKPSQALGVSSPIGGGFFGEASVVVEVYTFGSGVSIKGQGDDLPRSESAFELETHGEYLVFDPVASTKANWVVASIHCEIRAVGEPLEAVDQEDVTELGCGAFQGKSPYKTVILSLPPATGKTTVRHALAQRLGCTCIVEEWRPHLGVVPGGLHLTNCPVPTGGAL